MTTTGTREGTHHTITVNDGTQIYYKDWGQDSPSSSAMAGL